MKSQILKNKMAIAIALLMASTLFFSCKKSKVCTPVTVRDTIYDVKDGLIAYYNFNGGNLNDSSGFGNNIVENYATPTTDRFGKANNAYLFNGSSCFMRVPNNNTLTPFNITIEAIFRIDGYYSGICRGNEILSKGYPDGAAGNYLMRFQDASPCSGSLDTNSVTLLGTSAGIGINSDTSKLHTGKWYQCVYTYDGKKARIYVDSKLKIEQNATLTYAPNFKDLFIGRNGSTNYPYYFNGAIDEIRIYNRALSANAINQLYNATE